MVNKFLDDSIYVRLMDGDASHPNTLDNLSDEEIDDRLIDIFEKHCRDMPGENLLGNGDVLFVGYDAEWQEIEDGSNNPLRVLSYQLHAIGPGGEIGIVFFPVAGERFKLFDMLDELIARCMKVGVIIDLPSSIILVGFMTRTDLAVCDDVLQWRNDLSNVGGSLVATDGKIQMVCRRTEYERIERTRNLVVANETGGCVVPIRIYDMAKHAPAGCNLAALGEMVNIPKKGIPEGFHISKMIDFLAECRDDFIEYGLCDAEIAVNYYLHVLDFARRHVGGGRIGENFLLPVSAGALAVKKCLATFEDGGMEYYDLFGLYSEYRQVWDDEYMRLRRSKQRVKDGHRLFHEIFSVNCYHGGRNECYGVGASKEGIWNDFDLKGAYSTGMLSIREIDYENSFETRDTDSFKGNVMGFAWVEFEFNRETRFPCLPVRTAVHGLQFPLSGESYCTAPELGLALRMGATIVIKRGVVYPWKNDSKSIFEPFVHWVDKLRGASKKGSLFELYVKLLGNSLYGKTAQGLKEKSVFDAGLEQSIRVPESDVSNGPMAAHITGFVRAVMGEILNGVPDYRVVLNCVTDGILTNASRDELDLSGELCQRFQSYVDALGGGESMLTLKHQVKQALSMRTRGVCTLQPGDHQDQNVKRVVLAKSSVSPPQDCADKNGFVVDLYLKRRPQQKTMTRPFVSVRDQYLKMSDVFRFKREVRLNLEFDFKRKPINPRMVETPYGEVLAFDTVSWGGIEDAELVRAIFDGWRNDNCLKTLQDWDDWEDHYHAVCLMEQMRVEKKGRLPFQLTKEGSLGMLKRFFLRVYVQQLLGLTRELAYADLVSWMHGIGFVVSIDDVKNGNRGKVLNKSVPSTPRTRKALVSLRERFPSFATDGILFEGNVP